MSQYLLSSVVHSNSSENRRPSIRIPAAQVNSGTFQQDLEDVHLVCLESHQDRSVSITVWDIPTLAFLLSSENLHTRVYQFSVNNLGNSHKFYISCLSII